MNPLEFFQKTNTLGNQQMIQQQFDWVFWSLILFNLFAFAYVRTVNKNYIRVLFRTGIYNRQLYQNTQEDLRLGSTGSVLLTIAYFNCVAIIVATFISADMVATPFIVLGFVIGIIIVKYFLIKSLGFVTQTKIGLPEHWMNHLIFFQMTAIILTPILALLFFIAQSFHYELMQGLLAVIALMIILREIHSLIRAIRLRLSFVYIILYLCTLEIIPLVVVIRAFVK